MPFTPLVNPKPPQLKPLGASNTGFRLQVIGDAGSKVEVQGTGDFRTWEAISSVTLGNQATEVEDSAAGSRAHRFYRAVQTP